MDSIPTTCIRYAVGSFPNQNDRSTSRSAEVVMAENIEEKETRSITGHASDTNRECNQIPESVCYSSRSTPASKDGACGVPESSVCDNDDRSSMECHENKSKYTDQIFEKGTKVTPKRDQAKNLQTLPVECYPSPGEFHDTCESVDTDRHTGAVSSWQEYANVGDCDAVKNEVLNNLDSIEEEVEKLRTQALALEEKRTDLLGSLQVLQEARELLCLSQCDREEIEVNANRIICRCLTIDISVLTPRTSNQEKALAKADKVLQTCRNKMDNSQSDDGVKLKIQAMLNACITNCDGPVDDKFQALVLDCAADDQKVIRKKLHDLLMKAYP